MKTLSSCSCVQNGTRGRAPRWGSGTPGLYFFLWTHTYKLPNKDQGAPETHAVRWGRGTLKGRSAHCTRGRWAHCLHSTKSKEEVRCRDLCECRCEFIANPLGDAASASESRPTPITSARSYQQKDPKCSFFANHGLCRFPDGSQYQAHSPQAFMSPTNTLGLWSPFPEGTLPARRGHYKLTHQALI